MASSWLVRRIGDFAQRKKVINAQGEDLPPLSVTKNRGVILQSEKYNKRVATDPRKYVVVEDGDFAFDPMSLYYGALGRVEGVGRGLISPDYVSFNVDASVDPAFMEYLLRSPHMVRTYEAVAQAGNQFGKRRRVYWSVLAGLPVSVPAGEEQRKIANVLRAADQAVAAGEAVVEQVDRLWRDLAKDLLEHGVCPRSPGPAAARDEVEPWPKVRLGDVCAFSGGNGFTPRDWTKDGLPIIRIQNLNGSREFHYFAGEPEPEWIIRPGDLLFAWAGSRGTSFGPCLWRGPTGVLNQHIHKLVPVDKLLRRFLYYVLQTFTAAIEKRAHGFSGLVHVRKAELTGLTFALPSLGEQHAIVAVLDAVEARLEGERKVVDQRRKLRAALSSALLTGMIRVPPRNGV